MRARNGSSKGLSTDLAVIGRITDDVVTAGGMQAERLGNTLLQRLDDVHLVPILLRCGALSFLWTEVIVQYSAYKGQRLHANADIRKVHALPASHVTIHLVRNTQ